MALSVAAPAVIRVGLVGCGGFARFAVGQYRKLPGVSIEAVADVDPTAAERAAADLDAAVLPPAEVLAHPALDLIYIATPPAYHFEQAAAALAAGHYVLVEKPLATTADQARELERRAAGQGLGSGHWFWDRSISGGIFVEHGVHFFDLVSSWLGAGHVVAAARSIRRPSFSLDPGAGVGAECVEEQAVCTCRYQADHAVVAPGEHPRPQGGILFHFEHGFHQPTLLDRQEMRLVFERGEVRLFDWVPTRGWLRALVDDETAAALTALLPRAAVRSTEPLAGGGRMVRGRFREWRATSVVEIDFSSGGDKMAVYAAAVRDLAADQIAWIRDPAHARRLTEADSVAAVALACEADRLAQASG